MYLIKIAVRSYSEEYTWEHTVGVREIEDLLECIDEDSYDEAMQRVAKLILDVPHLGRWLRTNKTMQISYSNNHMVRVMTDEGYAFVVAFPDTVYTLEAITTLLSA